LAKRTVKKKRRPPRLRTGARFIMPENLNIEYKNFQILQKFVNERGKIVPRRITGLNAKQQRDLTRAIKYARFLALLPSGGVG
jgi:small subunit ribosomal protein S18